MTMKLFADMERKRRELEQRDMEERKRKREQEIEEEEKANLEKEWQKNFEVNILTYLFCTLQQYLKTGTLFLPPFLLRYFKTLVHKELVHPGLKELKRGRVRIPVARNHGNKRIGE